MSFEELITEALKLSPEFRARLAKELLSSLDFLSESEVERLWIEEAIRRDNEINTGDAQLIPAAEVIRQAKANIK